MNELMNNVETTFSLTSTKGYKKKVQRETELCEFRFSVFICENQRNLRPNLLLELKRTSPNRYIFPSFFHRSINSFLYAS